MATIRAVKRLKKWQKKPVYLPPGFVRITRAMRGNTKIVRRRFNPGMLVHEPEAV
jgi:hypothetical protein